MASFRDLVVWQKAHQNFLEIVRMVEVLPNTRAAWEIERQLVRSAGSISANIAEGQGRQRFGRRAADCRNFFEIAYGSATETDCWLEAIVDLGWMIRKRIRSLQQQNEEVMKMLYVLVNQQEQRADASQVSRLKSYV